MELGNAFTDEIEKVAWIAAALRAVPAIVSAAGAAKDLLGGGNTAKPQKVVNTAAPATGGGVAPVPTNVSSNSGVTS